MAEIKLNDLDNYVDTTFEEELKYFYGSNFETIIEDIEAVKGENVARDLMILGILSVHTTKEVVYNKYKKLIESTSRQYCFFIGMLIIKIEQFKSHLKNCLNKLPGSFFQLEC